MRKLFLILLSAAVMAGAGVSVTAQPRLEIDEMTFDFGFVPQGSVISHDFWLKSVGADSLLILKVTPG
jgi:hypothetical protein